MVVLEDIISISISFSFTSRLDFWVPFRLQQKVHLFDPATSQV